MQGVRKFSILLLFIKAWRGEAGLAQLGKHNPPPLYLCEKTPWEAYLAQFNILVQMNGWGDEQMSTIWSEAWSSCERHCLL